MSDITSGRYFADLAKPSYTPPVKPDDGIRSKALQVTGRLKAAIDNMVWKGLLRDEAAQAADLTPHALYSALRKAHVKAYYLEQCEVLRTSGKARRIHRLEAMLEQNDNKAAVINAALALDRVEDVQLHRQSASLPGLVVQIVVANQPAPAIEHGANHPLTIEND